MNKSPSPTDADPRNAPTVLDRHVPVPLYYQLKQILLVRIKTGEIRPGDEFPTEKELEHFFGVSRITVRRALGELTSEGYLARRSGRKTSLLTAKVQNSTEKIGGLLDDLANQGFAVESKILAAGRQPIPPNVAKRLGVPANESSFYFRRLICTNQEPLALTEGFFLGRNISFTRQELESDSIYPLLERKFGIFLHRADKTIEAVWASKQARLLHASRRSPMLLAQWVVYDDKGQPVAFTQVLYRGDRYKHYSVVTR